MHARHRILFVHSSDPDDHLGGGETSLIALARHLDRSRFHPMVAISGAGEFQRRLVDAGIETRIVPMDPLYYKLAETRSMDRVMRAASAVPSSYRLARLMRAERTDLVCSNVQAAHIYAMLAARMVRRPAVMYLRDIPTGPFSRRFFPFWASRLAHHLIAISAAVRDFYARDPRHGARCARKISVVHNGIDLARFAPRPPSPDLVEALQLRGASPIITLVGRLQPLKGQRDLIAAAPAILARHPDARILLVGDTFAYERDFAVQLRAQARALGVEHAVVFAGQRSDIPDILAATDILVSASSREAFGRTLVEAMAMARPVVATRSGGPEDIVVHGETGYLVPCADAAALADALLGMWTDPARARAMGERGRARALARFDVRAMARGASEVFARVVGEPR